MNKTDFVKLIADHAGLTAKDSAKFLDAFEAVTTDVLSKGDTISLVGFGSFSVTDRAARTARDFRTGQSVTVPVSKAVKFKAGQKLKTAING